MIELKEARCSHCNKKLAMLFGKAEIKCPRCGTVNIINTKPTLVKN